ncbi:ROK family protein [Agrobacterium rosae]|uniref:N-acetylglucosamine kinase n=1 Tax=Agrobacterium rosae TaxID=1972867 RepID=A0AAE5RVZ0_9HYPH|nr:ROK family protein [Agrobacterium rosae]KAA3515666.1 ROK family protein [Agrobacterium rosae]KAA3524627.1 ROK family protein [Agrobacterium rosae]MCM2431567.1 ROK family protein [Agrobacterium rosae]MDX8328767.1 ROK family protein [Agrobacterium rosae]MQB47016.1 ROK family protein [Agrobacterium rosae]
MIVCFDIGGTAIKGAGARALDDIRPVARRQTPIHDFDAFISVLKSVIAEIGGTPECIALSITGIIDPDTDWSFIANIPCAHDRPLKADLEAALGLPVLIANDADCCALAEYGAGAGRGHRVVFSAILGTGVGGALVIDGKLINSGGGFAGEWGHGPVAATRAGNPPVDLPRFACGCGLEGCLDAICSARGMEKLHRHLTKQTLVAEEILENWQAGEADAIRTMDIYIDMLSGPLALVVNVTGATILPVGGGLSNSAALIEALDLAVRSRILRRFSRPLVVQAECTIEPGLVGAAVLGFDFLK